jgi:Uma2 family endonuclease
MQPASAPARKFTYDDYVKFPDDGQRHELIDGKHVVTPSPALRHQEIIGRLHLALGQHVRVNPAGKVYMAPLDVILPHYDVVEPDLLYVSNERAAILQDWVRGAPDLVIEVLSPSTRRHDELRKRRLYERVDTKEYSIVDPELDLVKVFRRSDDGTLPRVAELTREESHTLSTPLLPGFSLPLNQLFD